MEDLAGRTVIVTRAPGQAGELEERLRDRGAQVLLLPTLAIEAPESWSELDQALSGLGRYDMILLGSQNAANALCERAAALGVDLTSSRFGCVGRKTAEHLGRLLGVEALVPEVFRAEALVASVREHFGQVDKRRFLVPRGDQGREVLIDQLSALGAEVHGVTVYRAVPAAAPPEALLARLEEADACTFLSGKTLENFLAVVPGGRSLLGGLVVAVIGPVTAEAARAHQIRVDVMPEEATVEALVEALAQRLQER